MNLVWNRDVAAWALWRLAAAAIIVALTAAVASAQYCTPDHCDECDLKNCRLSCCYDPPELWLVNTRCLPKCSNLDEGFERISIKRYDRKCGRWTNETVETFLAEEASMPSLIFAHGNTLKHPGAMKQCWLIYQKMRCCPGQKRLVFWSWPAQIAIKRPLLRPRLLIEKNLKIKYVYSEYQGYYMAKLVQRMSMTQRVTVGGHSYGAIIASSAAHFLGAGQLRGLTLAGSVAEQHANLRVANISGAFDNDAMNPGCRFGQSFVAAEKVLNTRNARDKTLDSWPDVSTRGRKAIGVTGINANVLGQYRDKLCQITMTADVGRSHYMTPHMDSARLVNALCCFSFPACADCANGKMPAATAETESDATELPIVELTPPRAFLDADARDESGDEELSEAA